MNNEQTIREVSQHLWLTGHLSWEKSENGSILIEKNSVLSIAELDESEGKFLNVNSFQFKDQKQAAFIKETLLPYLQSQPDQKGVFVFTMLPEMERAVLRSNILRSHDVAEKLGCSATSVRTTTCEWLAGRLKRSDLIYRIYSLKLLELLKCD